MVKYLVAAVFSGVLALGLIGCQKEEAAIEKAESKVEKAMDSMGKDNKEDANKAGEANAPAAGSEQTASQPQQAPAQQ